VTPKPVASRRLSVYRTRAALVPIVLVALLSSCSTSDRATKKFCARIRTQRADFAESEPQETSTYVSADAFDALERIAPTKIQPDVKTIAVTLRRAAATPNRALAILGDKGFHDANARLVGYVKENCGIDLDAS
jgi:hypothetical protein